MKTSFKSTNESSGEESSYIAALDVIDRQLQLHGLETSDLIHQYFLEQHKTQSEMTSAPYGQLTVRCWFKGDYLEVRVCLNLVVVT